MDEGLKKKHSNKKISVIIFQSIEQTLGEVKNKKKNLQSLTGMISFSLEGCNDERAAVDLYVDAVLRGGHDRPLREQESHHPPRLRTTLTSP